MKEILATAYNSMILIANGKPCAIVEAVITVCEPAYSVDEGGKLQRIQTSESFRFVSFPDGLRAIAKNLCEQADETDKVCKTIIDGFSESATAHEADDGRGNQ